MPIYIDRLYTKIRLTMLCLSGFELYSCWAPLSLELLKFAHGCEAEGN